MNRNFTLARALWSLEPAEIAENYVFCPHFLTPVKWFSNLTGQGGKIRTKHQPSADQFGR